MKQNGACFKLRLVILSLVVICNVHGQNCFPLDIGNRWNYSLTECSVNLLCPLNISCQVIKDTVFQNGLRYHVLDNEGILPGRYFRTDIDFIYSYSEAVYSGYEDTLFAFNLPNDSVWDISNNNKFIKSCIKNRYLDTLFGIETNVIEFVADGVLLKEYVFSDRFGPIKSVFKGEPPGAASQKYDMAGCVLDGITYGNMTGLRDNGLTGLRKIKNYGGCFYDLYGHAVKTRQRNIPSGIYFNIKNNGIYKYILLNKKRSHHIINTGY